MSVLSIEHAQANLKASPGSVTEDDCQVLLGEGNLERPTADCTEDDACVQMSFEAPLDESKTVELPWSWNDHPEDSAEADHHLGLNSARENVVNREGVAGSVTDLEKVIVAEANLLVSLLECLPRRSLHSAGGRARERKPRNLDW